MREQSPPRKGQPVSRRARVKIYLRRLKWSLKDVFDSIWWFMNDVFNFPDKYGRQ